MRMKRKEWVSSKRVLANQKTGRSSISLRRLEAERPQENGWHEPYEKVFLRMTP